MRYEVEQAGDGSEHRPNVGTHAEPERWHMVRVFNVDAVPMPLRFDMRERMLAYTYCAAGPLRIVEVTDENERVPMGAGVP